MVRHLLFGFVSAFMAGTVAAQVPVAPAKLVIDAGVTEHAVSPMLYGLMTEEINHSYEGGLYAELLKNRTFRRDWAGIEAWTLSLHGTGLATMDTDKDNGPSTAIPNSVKVVVTAADEKNRAGLANGGWWGLPVHSATLYKGSFYAKSDIHSLTARLVSDDDGRVLAEAAVPLSGNGWARYDFVLKTGAVAQPSARNHFELLASQPGTVWLQLVSLMPPTYAGRANGNRVDLMERMAAMHPKFLRLPGGNYLEGDHLVDWYDWKKTLGPLVDRPGHQAPWSYWSTDGLGLLEFLEWCEDLHMEPVLAVYAGYSLKGEHVKAGKDMEPYVDAALEEVEYVTGDASTKWGAERAKDGHPAPFPLKYVEIGNEDWLDHSGSYKERYPQFAEAFRKRYPQLKLIATTNVKSGNFDVVDDHYYKTPGQMFELAKKYDTTPRDAKVFVGEWATRSGAVTPNFGDALGDAAFMTGLERNSDVVVMAAYAPLLVNVNPGGMQWATDLIGYDAEKSFGSPSYWAQVMFATKLGDSVVKSDLSSADARFFVSATRSGKTLFLKLVNASDREQALSMEIAGAAAGPAKLTSLHGASYQATNSLERPEAIKPVSSSVKVGKTLTVPALTIEVLEIPLK